MRRKFSMLLAILAVIGLTATTALAGSIHFNRVSWGLGSLIADGILAGLGQQDVAISLDATGIPVVSCANQGGNLAQGQNPPKVSARGVQFLVHQTYTKNGSVGFTVETVDDPLPSSAKKMGCPSNNWTATIDFVFWTKATIEVRAGSLTGPVLLHQDYDCVTTREPADVTCTPVP